MRTLGRKSRRGVCGLAAFWLSAACAAAAWQDLTPLPGQQTDMPARSNGVRYRIMVALPDTPPPETGYPVLYVLDGNAMFPVAAQLARTLARRSSETGMTPPLVVGVGYPQDQDFDYDGRARDYTPAIPGEAAGSGHGGAEPFYRFLQDELKPAIGQRFPVDARRQGIFGHSYGGLFVSHVCLNHPDAFSTCIASSPSLWWGNRMLLAQTPAPDKTAAWPAFQVTVGEHEDDPPPGILTAEKRALWQSRPMIAPARQFAATLQALPGQSGRVRFQVLAGEDHGTSWMTALARGMKFLVQQP